jgi:hypothetical protein
MSVALLKAAKLIDIENLIGRSDVCSSVIRTEYLLVLARHREVREFGIWAGLGGSIITARRATAHWRVAQRQ